MKYNNPSHRIILESNLKHFSPDGMHPVSPNINCLIEMDTLLAICDAPNKS